MIQVRMVLNGESVQVEVRTTTLLLDMLRARGLTGAKEGCGVGVCGVCTVLVDERPISSCLYLAASADGARVTTVEGLAETDPRLIDSFVVNEGLQCGICTPGQVVAAAALRRQNPGATDDEIADFMAGNLCRCTGYRSILDSVRAYLASA